VNSLEKKPLWEPRPRTRPYPILSPFATFATNAGVSPETSVDVGGCRPSRHDFVMIEFLNYEKRISDSISASLSLRQNYEKPALEAGFFVKSDLRRFAFGNFLGT
jgi:hypothetical protein